MLIFNILTLTMLIISAILLLVTEIIYITNTNDELLNKISTLNDYSMGLLFISSALVVIGLFII